MERNQKKKFIRLVYTRTLRYFSVSLVLSAVIAAFYGDRLHFVFALCAMGGVFLAWGWFTYLRAVEMRLPGFGHRTEWKKVPYILRKEKQKLHKPAFAMTNDDFDDDLVNATTAREEEFSKPWQEKGRVFSRILCAVLLFLVSFVIKP